MKKNYSHRPYWPYWTYGENLRRQKRRKKVNGKTQRGGRKVQEKRWRLWQAERDKRKEEKNQRNQYKWRRENREKWKAWSYHHRSACGDVLSRIILYSLFAWILWPAGLFTPVLLWQIWVWPELCGQDSFSLQGCSLCLMACSKRMEQAKPGTRRIGEALPIELFHDFIRNTTGNMTGWLWQSAGPQMEGILMRARCFSFSCVRSTPKKTLNPLAMYI